MKLAISNPKVGMVPSTQDCAFRVGDEMQTACTVIFEGRTSVLEWKNCDLQGSETNPLESCCHASISGPRLVGSLENYQKPNK